MERWRDGSGISEAGSGAVGGRGAGGLGGVVEGKGEVLSLSVSQAWDMALPYLSIDQLLN